MLKNMLEKELELKKLFLCLSLCVFGMIPLASNASLLTRADDELDAEDRAAKYEDIFFLTKAAIANRVELKAGLENILATAVRPGEAVIKLNALKTRVDAKIKDAAKNITKLTKEIEEYDRELEEEYAQAKRDEERQKKQSYASQAWAWATTKKEVIPSKSLISREYEIRVPELLAELDTLTTTDIPYLFNAIKAKFNNNSPAIISSYNTLLSAYKKLENAQEKISNLDRQRLDVANAEISRF